MHKIMKFVMVAMFVLAFTTQVMAGGPPPVCMMVDKVVLEPDNKSPDRIQICGKFVFCSNNSTYGKPVEGYLYYTVAKGKEDACRQEWAKLQKLVADKHVVALGSCGSPNVDGHLRNSLDTPKSPVVFPIKELEKMDQGFTNGDAYESEFTSIKKSAGSKTSKTARK